MTNLFDVGAGSLRDAIATTPAGGTVSFQPGLSGTIQLTSTLNIAKNLTIAGPGADAILLNTTYGSKPGLMHTSQVFTIAPAVSVNLSGLSLTSLYALTIYNSQHGGSIENDGTLVLSNCTVSHFGSQGEGGAIYNGSSGSLVVSHCTITGNSAFSSGGGIYNEGKLTVANCSFSGNSANSGGIGGAISNGGTAMVTDSTFSGNQAYQGSGIANEGNLTVDLCTFTGLKGAFTDGGGIFNSPTANALVRNSTFLNNIINGSGGGIDNQGTATVEGSLFSANSALGGSGGGISNEGTLTVKTAVFAGNFSDDVGGGIANTGALSISQSTLVNNNGEGAGAIGSTGPLTISGSTLSGNRSEFGASAIQENGALTVVACAITGNTLSGSAQAVVLVGGGTGAINNSMISGNHVNGDLATVVTSGTLTITGCTINGNTDAQYGAIDNSGTLTVTDSLISNNTGLTVGGILNSGTLNVSNSTVAGNDAYAMSPSAGGIANIAQAGDATTMLVSCTIANNTCSYGNHTGSQVFSGCQETGTGHATLFLRDTIVGGDNRIPDFLASVGGTVVSLGHNLSSDGGNGFLTAAGDLTKVNPQLGPLQDNGGLTFTMALLPDSPAIHAGDPSGVADFDQRGSGYLRVMDGMADIGAYEVQVPVFVVTTAQDSGPGSLRQAILQADQAFIRSTISFAIGTGPQTINLASPLPAILEPVVLDGTTQPGYAGKPLIELNGTAAGPLADGLLVRGGDSVICGLVINRFAMNGIELRDGGGDVIEGNYIGTDSTGTQALGNGNGLRIASSNNTIGGAAKGTTNLIADNGKDGVLVDGGIGNRIQQNSIFVFGNNSGLGIELMEGGNNNLHFPFLTAATSDSGSTTVSGLFEGDPNTTVTLEFFANPVSNPSGFGEGKQFLGSSTVTTDNLGNASFLEKLTSPVLPGQSVAATASDASLDTSEFSNCVGVVLPPPAPAGAAPRQQSSNLAETTVQIAMSPTNAPSQSGSRGTDVPTMQSHAVDVLFGTWHRRHFQTVDLASGELLTSSMMQELA